MAFLHRYRFAVAEDVIPRYRGERVREIFVIRTSFKVVSVYGAEKIIDSEEYIVSTIGDYEFVRGVFSMRLESYFMPDEEINGLIGGAIKFAEAMMAGGRRGKIPVVAELDVCTVQQEGETIEATEDRAMKLEYLPPLHIYPVDLPVYPWQTEIGSINYDCDLMDFLRQELGEETIKVEDVERGLRVMEVCSVCGRKPMVGTQILKLRCGHPFHYHCIVRRLEMDMSCPICNHPARDHEGFDYNSDDEENFGPPGFDSDDSELPDFLDYDELSVHSDE